jgi:radical SAM superfamily enzyme
MAKLFYDHLIKIEEVSEELGKYRLTAVEREEILNTIDEHIHHRVLDVILQKLPREKHEVFLHQLHDGPQKLELLEELKKEIKDLEKLIGQEGEKIKKEILAEIKRAQKML